MLRTCDRHAERLVAALVRFKLTPQLEAQIEVVSSLLLLMLLNRANVHTDAARLAKTPLVLAHVVQFVAAHREVRLCIPTTFKDAPILGFSRLDSS